MSSNCNAAGECSCKEKYYGKKCRDRDCEVSDWSAWSPCRCGYEDQKTRERYIVADFSGNGWECPSLKETSLCEMTPCNCSTVNPGFYGPRCEDRDCLLSQWSNWSPCVKPCPSGTCKKSECPTPAVETRTRSRNVLIAKAGNGTECTGETSDETDCPLCIRTCAYKVGGSYTCHFRKASK